MGTFHCLFTCHVVTGISRAATWSPGVERYGAEGIAFGIRQPQTDQVSAGQCIAVITGNTVGPNDRRLART